ncbi:TMF_TATA_bd domain-containing protein/TMF_DNA_bd domain-containing protein [Cephalotus follicularis]|uniref:TMF_TATA_bd domain-containing protein/TMF_DNA_bd domain-containing protein n=1 Tax=Cephalotus follicularis TaxID=3775 RepID=A0A1Q3B954_CEPFO|nr:TMF_TATA_bd domain-containing protein/TMF_DNA_bd domain-containing protein [Cephalotus follicularis]
MAWFSGKVSLGNFPDLAGAVNKLSESVKNIEKNFDNALGFEEKSESSGGSQGLWPVMAFMGHKSEESTVESSEDSESSQHLATTEDKETSESTGNPPKVEEKENSESSGHPPKVEEKEKSDSSGHPPKAEEEGEFETDRSLSSDADHTLVEEDKGAFIMEKDNEHVETTDKTDVVFAGPGKDEAESQLVPVEPPEPPVQNTEASDSVNNLPERDKSESKPLQNPEPLESKSVAFEIDHFEDTTVVPNVVDMPESMGEQKTEAQEIMEESCPSSAESSSVSHSEYVIEPSSSHLVITEEIKGAGAISLPSALPSDEDLVMVSESLSHENDGNDKTVAAEQQGNDTESDTKQQRPGTDSNMSDSAVSVLELEKVKMEMKMMETALQGAARQAQAKADEIAKMMNENENLKAVIEDLKRKSNEAEMETLREEYHQRVATLERKVYALTKERDTLRREQNKKSDAAALLKEKDEIINQVMAEGEELSKKQAAQEAQMRKLRAQIRELDEEKKGLSTKLQVEENKVESIKRDKTATEKLLQETIETHQAELAAQKEYYTNALTAAKEAEALAEARANSEARTELESRLREAEEREAMLVQALDELRQTLSRKEQQAVFKEDMLCREIEDLQKRYQASERRCEELITQVPESTRPLLRQIEAMQETNARRAEAWAAVERSLNSRLQEAEAKSAAAEERERSVNERLSQTLSRINVLEAQISCLRAEQTQLSRSLEKERQRAAENRQEYLAAKEEADTQEGRASQLEAEIKDLRQKHKQELQDALLHRELLQQELDREKAARLELERTARAHSTAISDQTPIGRQNSAFENGNMSRRLSSASSLGSMEESYFLQASLDSSDNLSDRRNIGETTPSPFYMKGMTPSVLEATLRQKEGELASYMSRLASMESIRDSLAEELVKMTGQCEKLRAEAANLPGIRAELESLRRRHSSALELMGERDEELEELRADIVDLKEMYREQVNLLVDKIQILSSSMGNA